MKTCVVAQVAGALGRKNGRSQRTGRASSAPKSHSITGSSWNAVGQRLGHAVEVGGGGRAGGRARHGAEPATSARANGGSGRARHYTPWVPLDAITDLGARAKAASRVLATASTEVKDAALLAAADLLLDRHAEILAANAEDVAAAEAAGERPTVVDRLRLSDARLQSMAAGLRQVAGLADPVGEVTDGWVRPNGLQVQRVRVPLGVVAIIYENRPNVTSDAFGLCLKSGNAAFLRGLVGRHPLEHRHRQRAARGPGQGRPARTTPWCWSRTPATRPPSSSCACASRSTCSSRAAGRR